jgi:hypothetical protein
MQQKLSTNELSNSSSCLLEAAIVASSKKGRRCLECNLILGGIIDNVVCDFYDPSLHNLSAVIQVFFYFDKTTIMDNLLG